MKRGILIFLLLALISLPLHAVETKAARRILFLNSGDSRSAPYYELLDECSRFLVSHNVRVQAQYEDLDMAFPNSYSPEEIALRMGHILQRLKGHEFDMVVPLGQGAVDALAAYSSYLPDSVAVIPVGTMIDTAKLLKVHRNIASVICEAGEEKCLELMFNMLPATESVFFIAGSSAESQASKERVRKLQARYPKLKCLYPDNAVSTLDEVADQIEISGRNTVVILEGWKSNDKNGMELESFMHRLRRMRALVFTITDGIYDKDALGGAYAKSKDTGVILGNEIRGALRRGNVCSGERHKVLVRGFVNCMALDMAGLSQDELPLSIRKQGLKELNLKNQADFISLVMWGAISVLALFLLFSLKMCHSRRFMRRIKAMLTHMPGRLMVSDANDRVRMLHYYDYLHFYSFGRRYDELPLVVPGELRSRAHGVLDSKEDYVCTQEIDGCIYKVNLIYMAKEKLGYEAVLWHLDDITDYAIASKHSRRYAEAKSNFVAMVSHELRSFLDAIIGHSELLQQKNLTDSAREKYLYNIYAAAKSLSGLIEETTDLTRLENNTMESHPAPTDVNEITDDVAKVFSKLADDKGIYLRFEPVKDLPMVIIDGVHLRQILSIVVNNAVKYTEQGGAVIRLKHSSSKNGKGINLLWEVEDTGIGIADEDKRSIFEPFEHGNMESKLRKRHGGYGLGLPVARSLARYIGGNVTFVSEKSRGSVFSITFNSLPVVDEDGSAPDIARAKAEPIAKAIVVEENPVTRNMLASMLRNQKIEVLEAASAGEAFGVLEKFRPDAVFTEYSMRDMTGDELAQKIHCSPRFFNVKVVAVTADVSCADKSGDVFDGIIYKPVTKRKLASLLETLQSQFQE